MALASTSEAQAPFALSSLRTQAGLEMSWLEDTSGRLELADVRRDTADELSELGARKGVRIELDVADAAPTHADPMRIEQVVINLIANAIKFTAADTRVLLRYRQEPDCDRVSVIDQGIGIAAEHHQRIFESFEQVPGQKQGGTGLGLAISRTLVRRHGGELWVDSALGQGATFHIRLPRPARRSSAA